VQPVDYIAPVFGYLDRGDNLHASCSLQ